MILPEIRYRLQVHARGAKGRMPMGRGLLVAAFDFSTAHADEFHDWYDLEHLPERRAVPGLGATGRRRLAHVPAKWTPVRRQEHAQKMEARIATSRSIISSRRGWRGAPRGTRLSTPHGPPGCARTSATGSAS